MGQVIFGLIGAYLLYHFIFSFIIPLVRVTRQVKRQVHNFKEQVNTQQSGFPPNGYQSGSYQSSAYNATQGFGGTGAKKQEQAAPRKDDYIDFEEIR